MLLSTPRLHLDLPKHTDVPQLIRLCNDPLIAEMTLSISDPYEESDAIAWLHAANQGRRTRSAFVYAIRTGTGAELMGGIGIHVSPKYGHGELGFWMGAPYRGKGYVTEAIGAVIDFGFRELELPRIHAIHKLGNDASGGAMLRNGMRREATLEDYVIKDGRPQTVVLYRILRGEYKF